MDQEQQRYERAHARVQAIKGFYIHASAFVVVNIALLAINVLVGGVWWFYWPLIGWGIGVGLHAFAVFGFGGGEPWGRQWEERKMQEMIDKERGRRRCGEQHEPSSPRSNPPPGRRWSSGGRLRVRDLVVEREQTPQESTS